jgi:hypothetical protein
VTSTPPNYEAEYELQHHCWGELGEAEVKITIEVPDEYINGALKEPHSRYWASFASWDPAKFSGVVHERLESFDVPKNTSEIHNLNRHALATALCFLGSGRCLANPTGAERMNALAWGPP